MQYQTNYPYATSQQNGSISQLREEQRRKQQEYSQALAEQVAQREQQKRRDREMDQQYGRRNSGFQSQSQQQQDFRQSGRGTFAPPERGMLDGLGRKDYQQPRKSFARGQPQHQIQPHHNLPNAMPPPEYYPPALPQTQVSQAGQLQPNVPNHQPPVGNEGYMNGFGYPGSSNQQQTMAWQQQQPPPQTDFSSNNIGIPSFASGYQGQPTWSTQNPHQRAMSQNRASHAWPGQNVVDAAQAPPPFASFNPPHHEAQQISHPVYPQVEPPQHPSVHNGGRRLRTDIHDGSRDDPEEAKRLQRKLQQQQEMQLALERQIEEKRQQKLEAKRRQEEEDRRELQRFEEEQRRQQAEQEKVAEEKRRKAEIEQQKADQAAAAVAAANQQAKIQQQQKLHAQISQEQTQHPQFGQPLQLQPQQLQPQQLQPQFAQPVQQQPNFQPMPPQPLFGQPFPQQQQFQPPPQQPAATIAPKSHKDPFTNSRAYLFEDPPPQRSPQRDPTAHNNIFGHPNHNMSPIRGGDHGFPQKLDGGGHPVDPLELRRQYDDMREELMRQKQLVDQLQQAQARIQNQQGQASPMRSESGAIPTLMDLEKLRNELRGELAYREQIHQQELESIKRGKLPKQLAQKFPYPGVKGSLNISRGSVSDNNRERALPFIQAANSNGAPSTHPAASQRTQQLRDEASLDSSTASLHGESEFVYLDSSVPVDRNESDEDTLDEHSASTKVDVPAIQAGPETSPSHSPTTTRNIHQSVSKNTASISSNTRTKTLEDTDSESEDETNEFVMQKGIHGSPSHNQSHQTSTSLPTTYTRKAAASSHRYSRSPVAFSSPLKQSEKWRLESMGNSSDSDDELDASLSGEQLEALFQRNVRRHEILLGFQAKAQAQQSNRHIDGSHRRSKKAWAELHQQLKSNRHATVLTQRKKFGSNCSSDSETGNQDRLDDDALVASSRWMPSTLSIPADKNRPNQFK